MKFLSDFFDYLFEAAASVPFDILLLIDLCAYCGIFLLVLALCFASRKVKYCSKRPFFHLTNAFAAVTLALFGTRYSASQCIIAAALFWVIGYIFYALLCALTPEKREIECMGKPIPAFSPATESAPPQYLQSAPAAQSTVRLDHALAISDKLLLKSLARSDRQELEKIKTALTILKVKGEFTPQDGEALNEMFNALLKMMARYDV